MFCSDKKETAKPSLFCFIFCYPREKLRYLVP